MNAIENEISFQSQIGDAGSTRKLNALSYFKEALDQVGDPFYKDDFGQALASTISGATPEDINEITNEINEYIKLKKFEAAKAKK
jgi:hypothetical protein